MKGGWIIGASGGNGVLVYHGRRYPLAIGGIDAVSCSAPRRLTPSAASATSASPYDVAGTYVAAGAGVAVGVGVRAIQLRNEKGALLQLAGQQVGLMVNADLSGLQVGIR